MATKPASSPQPSAPSPQSRYYTSPSRAGALHDDFRLLWDHVYKLEDEVARLGGIVPAAPATTTPAPPPPLRGSGSSAPTTTGMKGKAAPKPPATPQPGSPSGTQINGIFVAAVPPQNGDTLRYNSATGQFEFGP